MGCVHPFKGFKTGYKTDTGADDLEIRYYGCSDLLDIDCVKKPVLLANCPHVEVNGHVFLAEPVAVPCGSCVGCRMQNAKEWKIRNCLEMTYHQFCYFVTLTFDDDHVPDVQTKDDALHPVQLFLMRWRKLVGKFTYFGCFEYGSKNLRPHYHLLLYSCVPGLCPVGNNHFKSDTLSNVWKNGLVDVELPEPGSVSYVCGYMEKKQSDPNWNLYKVKPFRFMSRRPAIGFRYLNEHRALFGDDPHVYGHFQNGKKGNSSGLPSSFKRKVKEEEYYTRLKIAAEMAQESAYEVSKVVYRTSDPAKLNDIMESAMLSKIENLRIKKL